VVPSTTFVSKVVGLALVLQQIPFSSKVLPPFVETFPPVVAVVWVKAEATVVVRVGTLAVVKATVAVLLP